MSWQQHSSWLVFSFYHFVGIAVVVSILVVVVVEHIYWQVNGLWDFFRLYFFVVAEFASGHIHDLHINK